MSKRWTSADLEKTRSKATSPRNDATHVKPAKVSLIASNAVEDSLGLDQQRAGLVLDKFTRGELSEIAILEETEYSVIIQFRGKYNYLIRIEPVDL